MPSQYRKESRADPFDASWENLRKAFASPRYHKPRPWRSPQEMLMVRRFALGWFTNRDSNKPSGRAWARDLGIDHTWLLKLVRRFEEDPNELRRLQAYGDPTVKQLNSARKRTAEMAVQGQLRRR